MSLVRSCSTMTPEERQAFLAAECDGDPELKSAVEAALLNSATPTEVRDFRGALERAVPDHYRLIRLIGRGGMSEVFLAEDKRLNRPVAIKFLNEQFRKDPDRNRRFKREARSASALNHPNILIIHDIGEGEDVQFIVSEFVDGETLSSKIGGGKIPLNEALDIVIQAASALAASHKAGIVHRDLKPDNIMLRPDGNVKVLDFGLAKDTGGQFFGVGNGDVRTLDSETTSPGLILGTPQYMSPEQTRGIPLDGRTDIFSLGIILFEMISGQRPFAGGSMVDIIAAIIGKDPKPLSELVPEAPEKLGRVIDKCLQKDRENRYPDMEHLLADLKILKLELAESESSSRATRRLRGIETLNEPRTATALWSWKWISTVSAAVLLVLGVVWFAGMFRQEGAATRAPMRTIAIYSWNSVAGESVADAAAFSPDSKMIAFASTRTGSTEIWVKPIVGGDPIQVTRNGYYNQYPVWSPNGQELAFFSSRAENRGIWRAAFTGGQEKQLASGLSPTARPLRWSNEGAVYYQDGSELFMVDERSGERKQLTRFADEGIKPRSIAVAASGSAIAFSVQESDLWKIKLKSLDGSTTLELASSKDQIDSLAFDPNGSSVFYSASVDGTVQVFEASVEGKRAQVSSGASDYHLLDVSADGSKLLYASVSETSDLWMVNVQDSRESLVANDVAAEYWADISRSGKNVVYQSVAQPDRPFRGSIVVKELATPAAASVSSAEGFLPVWSPDEQWIAFVRRTDAGFGLWRSRPTGAEISKIVEGAITLPAYLSTPYLMAGAKPVSWSPDSKSIAYSAKANGVSNIWIVSNDGSTNSPVTENADPNTTLCCPLWSEDGRTIVFVSESRAPGAPRVFRLVRMVVGEKATQTVIESADPFKLIGIASTGDEVVVAQKADATDVSPIPKRTSLHRVRLRSGDKYEIGNLEDAYFHNIHLSPDGRSVAYVLRNNGVSEIWTIPVSGGSSRKVLVENDPKILISSLTWSPDGRSIVFGRQTRTNLLSMLTN